MSQVTGLWPTLTSPTHLLAAARAAARRKRSRPDVAAFLLNLETEVFALRRELLAGAWRPGPYRTFRVTDPKPRVISAAPFRDRVVHHALTMISVFAVPGRWNGRRSMSPVARAAAITVAAGEQLHVRASLLVTARP